MGHPSGDEVERMPKGVDLPPVLFIGTEVRRDPVLFVAEAAALAWLRTDPTPHTRRSEGAGVRRLFKVVGFREFVVEEPPPQPPPRLVEKPPY